MTNTIELLAIITALVSILSILSILYGKYFDYKQTTSHTDIFTPRNTRDQYGNYTPKLNGK